MSFMSRSTLTTTLLGVIAALLLVLVVQVVSRGGIAPSTTASTPSAPGEMPMQGQLPPGHPPIPGSGGAAGGMGGGTGGPMGGSTGGEFDMANMLFAGSKCPTDPAQTLDSPNCTGPEVDKRKAAIKEISLKTEGIRNQYDAIIKKFGEGALSDQALQIRKMRKAKTEAEAGQK